MTEKGQLRLARLRDAAPLLRANPRHDDFQVLGVQHHGIALLDHKSGGHPEDAAVRHHVNIFTGRGPL